MATPLKAYQTLYGLTSRILKLPTQNTDTHTLYFGVLCQNFMTLTLPSGSGSLRDADAYNNSSHKNSPFYGSELAKLATLSQNIFVNEVVVDPSGCSFIVGDDSGIDPLGPPLYISWFPNPLYLSYEICIVIDRAGTLGIYSDNSGTTSGILLSDGYGFTIQAPVGNVTSVDLAGGGYLGDIGTINTMNIYLFGYTGPSQTGLRSNIPSIMANIQTGDNQMLFYHTTRREVGSGAYLYNISEQNPNGQPLGLISGS